MKVKISTKKTYPTAEEAIQAVKDIAKKRFANITKFKAWADKVKLLSPNPPYITHKYEGHAKCIVELENKLDVSGAVSIKNSDIDALTQLVLEEIKSKKEELTYAETIVKLLKDCPTDALISIKGLIESILIDRKK